MKLKKSQKITVTIPTTAGSYPCQITTTVRAYPELFSFFYSEAIEHALKHIVEENINGIGFTCANGVQIQVSLN